MQVGVGVRLRCRVLGQASPFLVIEPNTRSRLSRLGAVRSAAFPSFDRRVGCSASATEFTWGG